jgi:hypothetical protein
VFQLKRRVSPWHRAFAGTQTLLLARPNWFRGGSDEAVLDRSCARLVSQETLKCRHVAKLPVWLRLPAVPNL